MTFSDAFFPKQVSQILDVQLSLLIFEHISSLHYVHAA